MLIEQHGVVVEVPRPQHRHLHHDRQRRLDQRSGGGVIGRRFAEVGLGRSRAGAGPGAEVARDHLFDLRGIDIADHHHQRAFGAIPAIVECLNGRGRRRLQGRDAADRRTVGERLAREEHRIAGIAHPHLRPGRLALFGQHRRPLDAERLIVDRRLRHHAGEQVQAFIQVGGGRRGQVELVGGRDRRGRCVGVRPEGRAHPLPDPPRLAELDIGRSLERQMLDQVRISALGVALHQRSGVHPHADRHLPRRHAVAAQRIAHAVGQRAEMPFRIGGDVAAAIQPRLAVGDVALAGNRGGRCGRRRRRCPHGGPAGTGDQRARQQQGGKNGPAPRAGKQVHGSLSSHPLATSPAARQAVAKIHEIATFSSRWLISDDLDQGAENPFLRQGCCASLSADGGNEKFDVRYERRSAGRRGDGPERRAAPRKPPPVVPRRSDHECPT